MPAPGERSRLTAAYLAPRNAPERFLAELWQDVLGLDQVGVHDDFFELGGDSIKGAILVDSLEHRLGEYVYIVALYDTLTIAKLAGYLSRHYPAAIGKLFDSEALTGTSESVPGAGRRIDAACLRELREAIEPLPPFAEREAAPNPKAVFLLSPPRSGSTLLRVMLGGHPSLFAPPELELLSFNTLAERKAAFTGRYSFWLEGLPRAIMELRNCAAGEARRIVEDCEERGLSSKELYALVQAWAGERLLVDKTVSYALDPEILRRAESHFENPVYIHLLRHPCGVIRSFEEARTEQLFFRSEHSFTARELAELVWVVSHQNIVELLREVPAERRHQVRFEELVADPEMVLGKLSCFLGLDLHPGMLDPYQEKKTRMSDGIHPLAKMLGDVKFHEHEAVDPRVAESWRGSCREDLLGVPTRELAAYLGYEV